VHDLAVRHDDPIRERVRVEVHHDPAQHRVRRVGVAGHGNREADRRLVLEVVQRRGVDPLDAAELLDAHVARGARALELLQLVEELGDQLLAVADEHEVDEVRERLDVENHRAADDHQRIVLAAARRALRDAREVEHLEHVGERHLVLQREADHVELAERRAALQRRERAAGLAERVGHVRPGAEDPLGRGVVAGVEQRVEDAVAEMGHPDLVDVREAEGERHRDVAVVLDHLVPLAADVAQGFRDRAQELLVARLVPPVPTVRHGHLRQPGILTNPAGGALLSGVSSRSVASAR
jgi:hypothetical protein